MKTSLAPGSQVVAEYFEKSGLQKDLDKLGFNLVGFGCTTCIGNSGPLPEEISDTINENDLVAAAVLSGNRNFEGRVNADVRANYLASPPLVVAYALAGSMNVDLVKQPLGTDQKGKPVFLKDIWPTSKEVDDFVRKNITKQMFVKKYGDVFKGDAHWRKITVKGGMTYAWSRKSTYVQNPPYFTGMRQAPTPPDDIVDARVLGAVPGFDHHRSHLAGRFDQGEFTGREISGRPQGKADRLQSIRHAPRQPRSDDARHLRQYPHQEPDGAGRRRRRHRALSLEGSRCRSMTRPCATRAEGVPLVVMAGKEYGTGSSRDWAAKGTYLLGVRAVVAQSFERIHRSNLVGMGVLPLVFEEGTSWQSLGMKGDELITIRGLHGELKPRQKMMAEIVASDGGLKRVPLICRIDTLDELDYFKNGGILQYVLRHLAA